MRSINTSLLFSVLLAVAGCAAAPSPPAPAPVSEEPAEALGTLEFPYAVVWTAMANIAVRTEYGIAAIPHLLTRLEVLDADSSGLRIRCTRCEHPIEGWVELGSVVYEPATPLEAADGELAAFALAVRKAALERDLAALRPVMFERFTYSFGGGGGAADAFNRWRFENYRTLDQLAPLLDRGLATYDGEIWSAPPEFATRDGYVGLRAGFRQIGGRWQWIYLVTGD